MADWRDLFEPGFYSGPGLCYFKLTKFITKYSKNKKNRIKMSPFSSVVNKLKTRGGGRIGC